MHWHDLKTKGQACKYANLIAKDQVLPFRIVENSALEKRINDAACLAIRECRGKTGGKKKELLKKTRSVKICEEDVDDVRTVTELERKCSELESESVEAKEYAKVVEDKLNHSIEHNHMLEEQNSVLTKQIKDTENPACQNCASSLENTSNKLDQVGTRQRQRKVKSAALHMQICK
jgi:hypothetical protein